MLSPTNFQGYNLDQGLELVATIKGIGERDVAVFGFCLRSIGWGMQADNLDVVRLRGLCRYGIDQQPGHRG